MKSSRLRWQYQYIKTTAQQQEIIIDRMIGRAMMWRIQLKNRNFWSKTKITPLIALSCMILCSQNIMILILEKAIVDFVLKDHRELSVTGLDEDSKPSIYPQKIPNSQLFSKAPRPVSVRNLYNKILYFYLCDLVFLTRAA